MSEVSYSITHGHSRNQTKWNDVRSYSWADLCLLLTDHKIGEKDGACFTPAIFNGEKRTKKDAAKIDLVVLDCDTGESLEDIQAAVQEKGWQAIIYSTHSHLTTEMEVSKDAYNKKGYSDPSLYLELEKGIRTAVAAEAYISDSNDSKNFIITHNPCPKFRVVMPLASPWIAAEFPSQEHANKAWSKLVTSTAKALRLHHDQSCIDSSRLYYLPRHSKGAAYVTRELEGVAIDTQELLGPDFLSEHPSVQQTEASYEQEFIYKDPNSSAQINLKKWAAKHAQSFDIVKALKSKKSEAFTGHIVDDCKYHLRCINTEMHTNQEKDNATFIVSPAQSQTGSFVYHCMHAHCADKDRLYFILKMLENRWLQIDDLSVMKDREPLKFEAIAELAEALDKNSAPDEIVSLIEEIALASLDPIFRESIFSRIKEKTGMSLKTLRQSSVIAAEGPAIDKAYFIAQKTLDKHFSGGAHLIRATDKCFWRYNGKHWQRIGNEQVEHLLLPTVMEHASPLQGEEYRRMVKNSLDLMISRQAGDIDFFKRLGEMPSVINCQNGELWFSKDGCPILKPHNPESYLQYVLGIPYDPSAECPRFDSALQSTFSNSSDPSNMARHLLEIMGYIIQPSRFLTSWFMFVGDGENGKTTLFSTLERLMSRNTIHSDRISKIEQNRFATGDLLGKLLLIDDDVDKGTKLPDGLMKKLSERKLITGEKKFKDSFEFISSVAILLLANNYPQCDDLSHGMRRRAHIVPFNRRFSGSDRDPALYPYIWQNEMSGVLNRLVEALQRLCQRGGFDEPEECMRAREEWFRNANPLAAFIEDCCEPAQDARITLEHFLKAFVSWKISNGYTGRITSQQLRKDIENLGYESRRRDGRWNVYGLRINMPFE